jgi:hypothetical protein
VGYGTHKLDLSNLCVFGVNEYVGAIAIPMVEDTINQVYDIVANSSFVTKEELLDIVGIWKKGWFHNIDLNHNFLWKQQVGSVGRAYGILSSAEEKEFIRENFPQYVQE